MSASSISNSGVLGGEDMSSGNNKDNDGNSNNRKRRASSESQECSICLGDIIDRCNSDVCSHQFCFQCLSKWAESGNLPRCPLCNAFFFKMYHNFRGNNEYDVHYVTLKPIEPEEYLENDSLIFSTNHESQQYEDHYAPITHHSASFAGNTPSFSRQRLSVANQNPVARQYPPVTRHSVSFAGNTPSFTRQYPPVANQNPVARQYPPVTRHSATFARNTPSFTRQYPPVANQYPVAPQYPLVVTTQYPLVATQYPQIAQQHPSVALGFSGVSTSGLFGPHHPRFAPTNSPFNNVSSRTGPAQPDSAQVSGYENISEQLEQNQRPQSIVFSQQNDSHRYGWTGGYMRRHPETSSRIREWIQEQIRVLVGDDCDIEQVVLRIMVQIRCDLSSRSFLEIIRQYFGDNSELFQRKLYHFMMAIEPYNDRVLNQARTSRLRQSTERRHANDAVYDAIHVFGGQNNNIVPDPSNGTRQHANACVFPENRSFNAVPSQNMDQSVNVTLGCIATLVTSVPMDIPNIARPRNIIRDINQNTGQRSGGVPLEGFGGFSFSRLGGEGIQANSGGQGHVNALSPLFPSQLAEPSQQPIPCYNYGTRSSILPSSSSSSSSSTSSTSSSSSSSEYHHSYLTSYAAATDPSPIMSYGPSASMISSVDEIAGPSSSTSSIAQTLTPQMRTHTFADTDDSESDTEEIVCLGSFPSQNRMQTMDENSDERENLPDSDNEIPDNEPDQDMSDDHSSDTELNHFDEHSSSPDIDPQPLALPMNEYNANTYFDSYTPGDYMSIQCRSPA